MKTVKRKTQKRRPRLTTLEVLCVISKDLKEVRSLLESIVDTKEMSRATHVIGFTAPVEDIDEEDIPDTPEEFI